MDGFRKMVYTERYGQTCDVESLAGFGFYPIAADIGLVFKYLRVFKLIVCQPCSLGSEKSTGYQGLLRRAV